MSLIVYFVSIYLFVPSFRAFANSILMAGENSPVKVTMTQNVKIFLSLGLLLVIALEVIWTLYGARLQEIRSEVLYVKRLHAAKVEFLEKKCSLNAEVLDFSSDCYFHRKNKELHGN